MAKERLMIADQGHALSTFIIGRRLTSSELQTIPLPDDDHESGEGLIVSLVSYDELEDTSIITMSAWPFRSHAFTPYVHNVARILGIDAFTIMPQILDEA